MNWSERKKKDKRMIHKKEHKRMVQRSHKKCKFRQYASGLLRKRAMVSRCVWFSKNMITNDSSLGRVHTQFLSL
jgi:hypothetical protein